MTSVFNFFRTLHISTFLRPEKKTATKPKRSKQRNRSNQARTQLVMKKSRQNNVVYIALFDED